MLLPLGGLYFSYFNTYAFLQQHVIFFLSMSFLRVWRWTFNQAANSNPDPFLSLVRKLEARARICSSFAAHSSISTNSHLAIVRRCYSSFSEWTLSHKRDVVPIKRKEVALSQTWVLLLSSPSWSNEELDRSTTMGALISKLFISNCF